MGWLARLIRANAGFYRIPDWHDTTYEKDGDGDPSSTPATISTVLLNNLWVLIHVYAYCIYCIQAHLHRTPSRTLCVLFINAWQVQVTPMTPPTGCGIPSVPKRNHKILPPQKLILPPRKLIFNTPEFEFYHRGNWFLPPRKLNFNTSEFEF